MAKDRIIRVPGYEGEERRAHPNGYLPWWVRAIAVLGVPSAIACFLIYVGAKDIPQIKTKVEVVHQTLIQVLDHQREIKELLGTMHRTLQRTCSNAARNENDRQRCFDK